VIFKNFAQVTAYLSRFTDYERMTGGRYAGQPYDLRRMGRLLDALDHPERGFASVHIAGTKGKGSTSHFAESIFRAHGLKTGLYTSPHLVHMLERIRLDGEPVTESLFVRTMNRMRGAMDRLRPTYFETMTAAAFLIFAERRVGMAVIEVGLGGRLDATNVIRPSACAIARIDYDHMDRLGSDVRRSLPEKRGSPSPAPRSRRGRAPRRSAGSAGRLARSRAADLGAATGVRSGERTTFAWEGRRYVVPAMGAFQAENASLALSLAKRALVTFDPAKAARGLMKARLPGRLEIVRRRPLWIVDVAHNPFAARASAQALRRFAAARPSSARRATGLARDDGRAGARRGLLDLHAGGQPAGRGPG
jgi:dihydrofolate synthase/folylpolyglutamate synthase